jgi:type II secretory pathway component PulF
MQIYDYRYRARRLRDSKIVKGTTEAPSQAMVSKFLQEQGLKPLEIIRQNSLRGQLSRISFGRVISERDLIFYLRQLHSLLRAGVKLNEASEMLATQQTNKQVRRILYGVYYDVNGGTSLADAYAEYPNDFPEIMIAMIRIGEQTGNLKSAIEDIVHYFETQYKIKNSIKQTMMMPIIYLVIALGVGIFLFVEVMPNFQRMFDDLGGDLPGVTKLFIAIGEFIKTYGILIGMGLSLGILIFIWLKQKSANFQRFLSFIAIKFPVLGEVTKLSNLSRISATLAQLLNNKVPLQECLATTYEVIQNRIYRDLIVQAQKNVNAGEYMSTAFEHHYAVEVIFTRMLSVGERTGELGKMLKNLSSFYDEDSIVKIERVRKLLEPILLLFIFSLVVIMLLAIMLPSLSYSSNLG